MEKDRLHRDVEKVHVLGPIGFLEDPIAYVQRISDEKSLFFRVYGDGERAVHGKDYHSLNIVRMQPGEYLDAAVVVNPKDTSRVGFIGFDNDVRVLVNNLELQLEGF